VIVAGVSEWSPLARRIAPPLGLLLAYDIAISVAYVQFGVTWVSISDLPLPLLGTGLGVFMGLRNNLAYARWWEARTLWGAAVNNSRSLVRALLWAMPGDPRVRALAYLQIAWAHALRCRLRGQPPWETIAPFLDEAAVARARAATNPPTALQAVQAGVLADALRDRAIDTIQAASLDRVLSDLANAQGGLERIGNTPLPRHFDHFPRIFIVAYCLLLPVGLVGALGNLTPLGSTLVGMIFLALDRIGRDLESPFANTIHDVAMSAITRTIEIDLRQMIGESDVPPPLAPVEGVLW
jgi:putative membrane protein